MTFFAFYSPACFKVNLKNIDYVKTKQDGLKMESKIKKHRRLQGLTQSQLGQRIWEGIGEQAAQSRIKRIESGKRELTYPELKRAKEILTKGFGQDSERRAFEEYCMVKEQYPEIEAWIKLLYHADRPDGEPNYELAKNAWDGLRIIAKQKIKISNSLHFKQGKVG